MLTRLKVSGFKNLVDVDVRFGPFTCIAGANGVGKSNLFDAIGFLSALAGENSLIEAAKSVRGEKTADLRNLFHRFGGHHDERMVFEAEMIIPPQGQDDLGQEARASITFVRYTLELALREDDHRLSLGGLELCKEELIHINRTEATSHLHFPHTKRWRESAITGKRSSPFISTVETGSERIVKLHRDRGGDDRGGGRAAFYRAATLPRTVLSRVNATENRTAVLAQREMQSWRILQLEPSVLRKPDPFTAPTRLGPNGEHLAATLYRLAHSHDGHSELENPDEERIYATLANTLSELIDVRDIRIDRDVQRELLTLVVEERDRTEHTARALSEGTLRLLALAVLELDSSAERVLCVEEPENGIHPARIPTTLKLLEDIAFDPFEPIGPDNPLRQVIVNTHSPAVVQQIREDSLVVAESRETLRAGMRFRRASFGCLQDTWRANASTDDPAEVVALGSLISFLHPSPIVDPEGAQNGQREGHPPATKRSRRVVDRPDLQPLLDFGDDTS